MCILKYLYYNLDNFFSQGPGWEYETPLPEWAKVDWMEYETE